VENSHDLRGDFMVAAHPDRQEDRGGAKPAALTVAMAEWMPYLRAS